jgi:hypothetical protein
LELKMTDKQLRQAIINPTQILVSDGTEVESNLGYFNLGAIGRDLLATATQAEALAAIGSPAFAGDATATITTNSVVRSQIDSSGNVSSTIPGGSTLLPEFKCRAWINFDGSNPVPIIRGSGNIASVTRVSTGAFQVNFLTEMPDVNYAAVGWCAQVPGQNTVAYNFSRATGSLGIQAVNLTGVGANSDFISVTVFR